MKTETIEPATKKEVRLNDKFRSSQNRNVIYTVYGLYKSPSTGKLTAQCTFLYNGVHQMKNIPVSTLQAGTLYLPM